MYLLFGLTAGLCIPMLAHCSMLGKAEIISILQTRAPMQGSSRNGGSSSASGLVSTLIPSFLLAAGLTFLFFILRGRFFRVYLPRQYMAIIPKRDRIPTSNIGLFSWISEFRQTSDLYVLRHGSLDGYLFLRFFKMLVILCFAGCCITWPILFPVNATGHGGQTQLDVLSFSNVQNKNRYYAHALVAWIFLGLVSVVIFQERLHFIGLRQAYFRTSLLGSKLSAKTVLFLSLPKDDLSEGKLRSKLGSSVRKVWMVHDCKKLEDISKDCIESSMKLEKAQIQLSQNAIKQHVKRSAEPDSKEYVKEDRYADGGANPSRWISEETRPTHRLKPLIGKKVDTIDWTRQHLSKVSQEVKKYQQEILNDKSAIVTAAFVEFSSRAAAQAACKNVPSLGPIKKQPRYIGAVPSEIVWKNLGKSWKSRQLLQYATTAFISLLILFWTIPVAVVGAISNVNYLTEKVSFLSFIDKIPHVILGVVTGLLPAVLLTVLFILVPIICRALAKLFEPTLSRVELRTQAWYFAFQVIQVFLITTFTSGASAVAAQIVEQPSSAVTLLAQNLPKASNFYISYFILQGLAIASMQVFSLVPLLMIGVLGKVLDKTPRKKFNRYIKLDGLGWGSVYPKFTNLAVIAISYSCIAPLILLFATIGLALLYFAFRYGFFFIFGNKVDTKGDTYARALQQLMTGVYLAALCLIGLFAIRTAIGPLVLMIMFFLAVAASHIVINIALRSVEQQLETEFEADEEVEREQKALEQAEEGRSQQDQEQELSSDVHGGENVTSSRIVHSSRFGKRPSTDNNSFSSGSNTIASAGDIRSEKSNILKRFLKSEITKSYNTSGELLKYDATEDYADAVGASSNLIFAPSSSPSSASEPLYEYTTRELDQAYVNPLLTVQAPPQLWLVRDELGVCARMVAGNNESGLASCDDPRLAWWNDEKKSKPTVDVVWEQDMRMVIAGTAHCEMGGQGDGGREGWLERVPVELGPEAGRLCVY